MKRLLALFALVLGMTSLVAPAHARMVVSAECSESAGQQAAPSMRAERHCECSVSARQKQRNRELGKPFARSYRTIIVPTVMLVDRPLE